MKYTEDEIMRSLQAEPGSADREQGAAMLLEQYAGLLWSVCARRLQDAEDIKECVNSTFAEVCLHPERYDTQKSSLKNYLCMVADRKAIDRYHENVRRQQAEEALAQESRQGRTASGGMALTGVDGFLSGNERAAEKLEEALEQLPPLDSQILRMKYYDGMTYQEIAASLGLTEATVKMRSLRSRKKLWKILIAILILALLAACAVAALRRYQYTGSGGFSWSEETKMYELVDGEYVWETDQLRAWIADADFVLEKDKAPTGRLRLSMTAHWIGEDADFDRNEFGALLYQTLTTWNGGERSVGNGYTFWFYGKEEYSLEYETMYMEWEMLWPVDSADQTEVTIPLYQGEEWLVDLSLKLAEYTEYDDTGKQLPLANGTRWSLGPAIAGETFTIVSLYGPQGEDLFLTAGLTYSRYGIPAATEERVALTGKDGTEYTLARVSYSQTNLTLQKENTQFDLYFTGAPAGEYQLHIPRLYYTSDQRSQEFTLSLPQEVDETIPCDVTALFSDGSGCHITGITKRERIEQEYQLDPDTGELYEVNHSYWSYELEVEVISEGSPELLFCGLTTSEPLQFLSTCRDGVFAFRMPQGDEPETIALQLADPEYVVEHDFTLDVTVQEAP